jgi:hypothetical protein
METREDRFFRTDATTSAQPQNALAVLVSILAEALRDFEASKATGRPGFYVCCSAGLSKNYAMLAASHAFTRATRSVFRRRLATAATQHLYPRKGDKGAHCRST